MSVSAGRSYYLVNKQSNTALDLSGGDNKSIIGYGLHDGDNQKWRLSQTGSQWTIQNASTGGYLTVDGALGSATSGTLLVAGSSPQVWDIWPDANDNTVYRIFIHGTTLNIDLSGHGNVTPGTPVQVWTRWAPGNNQCWKFQPA